LFIKRTRVWALMVLDPRLFDGVIIWTKPFKFAISIALQALTLWLLIEWISESHRHKSYLGWAQWIFIAAGSFELIYISLQAAQSKASHFNYETPQAIILYGLMGVGAVSMMLCLIPIGWALWRHKSPIVTPIVQSGALWGIAISLPLTLIVAGYLSAGSGHFVGPHDQTVPLLGWSLSGGDLRVSHFFALHALQACMLAGWIAKSWPKPIRALPLIMTIVFSVFLSAYSFVQALHGLPFTKLIS